MGWLHRWRGRGSRGAEADVVVVSRAGCHLCAQMEQVVSGVLAERPAPRARRGRLRVLDLDRLGRDDPALLERWTTRVPVLLVDDEEVAHWTVDPDTVRTALRR
jgi:hypothetical protein